MNKADRVSDASTSRARGGEKSAKALKTISEAADLLDVPQHVLRFWETKFTQIKPLKRNGGRRYYRPEDIETLLQIKNLLYKQGYTIKGAKKAFEKKSIDQVKKEFSDVALGEPEAQDNDNQPTIAAVAEPEPTITPSPVNEDVVAIQNELKKLSAELRASIKA